MGKDRVQFGALFPPQRLQEVGRPEDWGYDSVWSSEHILFYEPTLEALPVLAAFAARTQRILLGTAVYLLPLRPAVITAKTAATVDVLSGGRLILGIGVGGEFAPEFAATGVPVRQRGRRADEAIPLLRRLWSEDHVTHRGRFYPLEDVTMEPKPPQGANLPIWVAGRSEAAMARAGRLGDGWMPYLYTPQRFRDGLGRARAHAEAAGRDPERIVGALYQFIAMEPTYERAREMAVAELSRQYNQPFEGLAEKYCVLGTADDCAARLAEFLQAGAQHIILVPLGPGDEIEKFQAYAEELIPRVAGRRRREG